MNKLLIYCGFFLFLAFHAAAFELKIERERMTLSAAEEPLQNVLRRMSELGIRVRVDPEVNPLVSAVFKDREIREAVAAIIEPYGHAIIWEKDPINPSVFKPAEIHVFSLGRKDRMRELPPRNFILDRDPRDGALFVRDEILLKVRPGTDIERIVRQAGGTIIERNEALGIYKVRLPPDSDVPAVAAALGGQPGVALAEPDYAYPLPGVYRVDADAAPGDMSRVFPKEEKAPVAVLDTGLAPGVGPDGFVIASFDAVDPIGAMSDAVGHGTQMALIASGLIIPFGAKAREDGQIPVVAVRAMDDNGFTTNYTILKSIDFALENGAKVMSLSWGSEKRSDFLEEIVDYAASKGMIVVASAGNESTGKPVYPAAFPAVIGVGAVYPDGKTWENSNYGDSVSVYAPGFASLPVGSKGGEPGIYGGTSVSAAFVANRIAEYWSKHPEIGIREIKDAVRDKEIPLN
jgi:hypothetical protein